MNLDLKHRVNAGRVAVLSQKKFFAGNFGRVESEWKPDDTRVTFADFAISEKIIAELRRDFSGDDFCSEESNPQDEVIELSGRYAWVLDPIDGTNNYALGLPQCAISLALLKDGMPVYGFVYDYSRDRLIEGGPGYGLMDGRQPASVRAEPAQKGAMIGLHFPLKGGPLRHLLPLLEHYRVRSIGSGALNIAYCAIGLLDGVVDYRVKIWDIAAGYALIKAGGGAFHALEGDIFPLTEFHVDMAPVPYVAGCESFCNEVLGLLKGRAEAASGL